MSGRDQAHTQVQLNYSSWESKKKKKYSGVLSVVVDRGGLVDWVVGWLVGPTRSQQQPGRKSQKDSQW
jgi:hypothetical protein